MSGIGKVGDDVKLLLDPARLLRDEDLAVVGQLNDDKDEAQEGEE